MTDTELQTAPEYEALSYVWSQSPGSASVICLGTSAHPGSSTLDLKDSRNVSINTKSQLQVTRNLWDAFRRLRQRERTRTLWIDQLCINQKDDVERSQQVRIMDKIFTKARQVPIWLGETENGSDLAISSIPEIAVGFRAIGPCDYFDSHRLRKFGLPPNIDPIWTHISYLFARPWFRRSWVVQEAILAQSATVLCGGMELSFEHVKEMLRVGLSAGNIILKMLDQFVVGRWAASQLQIILRYQDPQYRSYQQSLRDPATWTTVLLRNYRPLLATDPKDKIFSLFGILPPHIQSMFPLPDYSRSVSEIYRDVALYLIQQGALDIMLSEAGRYRQILELPSWAPDWTYTTYLHTFNHHNGIAMQKHELEGNVPTTLYRASAGVSSQYIYLPELSHLTVSAKLIGDIVEVGQELTIKPRRADSQLPNSANDCNLETINVMRDRFEACFEMAKKCQPGPTGNAVMACSQALVGGMTVSYKKPTDSELKASFDAFYQWADLLRLHQGRGWGPAPDIVGRKKTLEPSAAQVHEPFALVHERRVMFRTRTQYIGMGPVSAQAGDLVSVILGCATPHILREHGHGYVLIGECYVYGLMAGEALDMDEYPMQDVTLI